MIDKTKYATLLKVSMVARELFAEAEKLEDENHELKQQIKWLNEMLSQYPGPVCAIGSGYAVAE